MDSAFPPLRNSKGSLNVKSVLIYLVVFIVILAIGYYLFNTVYGEYEATVQSEPWLVEYTKTASSQLVIPGSKIRRSVDGKYGIEFSYTTWLYLDEWEDNSRYFAIDENDRRVQLSHVLHKGDVLANPNQAPGIWLQRVGNDLRVVFKINTFHTYEDCQGEACYLEKCSVGNIPLNKWFHISLVVINKNVDVYVNGFLKKRCLLKGVPRQNDGDVYLNSFGGFRGFLSRARYFNYALPVWKIEQILKDGPSKYFGPDLSKVVPPYLSNNWWEQRFGIPKERVG